LHVRGGGRGLLRLRLQGGGDGAHVGCGVTNRVCEGHDGALRGLRRAGHAVPVRAVGLAAPADDGRGGLGGGAHPARRQTPLGRVKVGAPVREGGRWQSAHPPRPRLYMPGLVAEETSAGPAGSRSLTATLVAVSGPVLLSVTVKVTVSPTLGVRLSTVLVSCR